VLIVARKDSRSDRYFTSVDLTGKFSTFGIGHTLLMGGDYFNNDASSVFNLFPNTPPSFTSFNIFNPIYLTEPVIRDPRFDGFSNISTSWYGLYFQDQLELPYHLHALAGFRYDNADQENDLHVPSDPSFVGRSKTSDDRVSPRGGLLWRPIPQLSLYGSYSENFGASNVFSSTRDNVLPPETAQQWEVGAKSEL